jgi:hypothetical protein
MSTPRHAAAPHHAKTHESAPHKRSRFGSKIGAVALAALAVVAAAATPALAGSKGGSGTVSSSIWMASIDGSQLSATAKTPTPSLGDTLTFGTTIEPLAGWEYPMIAVTCYQDVNLDGVIDTSITGPDIVFSWLDKPTAGYTLGGYSSIWTLRGGGAAVCRADLDAYGWKGGKQSVRVLKSLGFDALG